MNFIAFLAVTSILFASCFAGLRTHNHLESDDPFHAFIQGIVEEVEEEGTKIEKLVPCFNSSLTDAIFTDLKDSLSRLNKINIDSIMKGLVLFVEVFFDITDMLNECMADYPGLTQIKNKLSRMDITQLIKQFILHALEIVDDVNTALTCFNTKKYDCIGVNVGEMAYYLFLKSI